MANIKILHLLPRMLSLYGEYGNLAVLKQQLEQAGHSVSLCVWEGGPLDLSCDMVYIGSGTEAALIHALEFLAPHKEALAAFKGVTLATGNAMALFGKTLTRGSSQYEGLGLQSYTTVIDDSKRFLGDGVVACPLFNDPLLGFINNSCIYTGITAPLGTLLLGKDLGNDKKAPAEGILEGSFFGTQLVGPVLAKNPAFLCHMAKLLTGQELTIPADSLICKAYEVSRKELTKRIG